MPATPSQLEACIREVGSGSRDAVARLFDEFGEELFYTAMGVTLHSRYAIDACEHLFKNLMRLIRAKRPGPEEIKLLLFQELRGQLRRGEKERQRLGENRYETSPLAPLAPGLTDEALTRAEEALKALAESVRELLAYRVWGRLSLADMARVTCEPAEQMQRRFRDALERAREAIRPGQGELADPLIWLGRCKFRCSAAGVKPRMVDAFYAGRSRPRRTRWILLLALAASLLAAYFLLDAEHLAKLRRLLGLS